MDRNTTEYDRRLLEYQERMLKRNIEMTSDDDDELDRLLERENSVFADSDADDEKTPSLGQRASEYQGYADKVDSVLKEVEANLSAKKQPEREALGGQLDNPLKNRKRTDALHPAYARLQQDKADETYPEEYDDYEEYEDAEDIQPSIFDSLGKIREKMADRKSGEKRPLTKTQKWILAFIIVLLLFICVTIAYLVQNAKYKMSQMDIHEIAEKDLVINEGVEKETKDYRTIVLYGVDSKESNLNQGTNSDAILIVSINTVTNEVKLVSVYRDTLVKIQSDSKPTHKINYAYQIGGALTGINTLNANLDLRITDYIAVDFNGMADIIDAMGGIEVSIEEDEINSLNRNLAEQIRLSGKYSDGIHEVGTQTLNGQQAVAYSRIRSTDMGDITRTERQREVLLSLVSKMLAADKTAIQKLIDVSFNCISTSITKDDAEELLKDIGDYQIVSTVGFPFAYGTVTIDGKGNVIAAADLSSNVTALHEYLYGNASYTPSETVAAISDEIKTETGVQAQSIAQVQTNTIDNSDNQNGTTQGDDTVQTLTEPPEGMLVNE